MRRRLLIFHLTALLVTAAIASCGYGIRPEPAIESISIGSIDNRTREPGLSDALRLALTTELSALGVRVSKGAEHLLSGTIEKLEVSPRAERAGSLVKYSISITGRFTLTGPAGETLTIRPPLSYIVAFGSDVPLESLYNMRDEAVRRATADLASDIASSAAYRRK